MATPRWTHFVSMSLGHTGLRAMLDKKGAEFVSHYPVARNHLVNGDKLHLTILVLNYSGEETEPLINAVEKAYKELDVSKLLTVELIGARKLDHQCLGIEIEALGGQLQMFNELLKMNLNNIGAVVDPEPYKPHVTIARLPQDIYDVVEYPEIGVGALCEAMKSYSGPVLVELRKMRGGKAKNKSDPVIWSSEPDAPCHHRRVADLETTATQTWKLENTSDDIEADKLARSFEDM